MNELNMFLTGSGPKPVIFESEGVPAVITAVLFASGSVKKTRRGRERKEGSPKLYFTSRTQEAIVEYQQAETKKAKDELYVKEILPAFEKLVENLINIHKFSGLYDSYDDLKNDCVNFLFETILKFDATRGTNAFSYFNVVAKNWLIIRAKQKTTKLKRNVSLDDQETLTVHELRLIEEQAVIPSQDAILETENMSKNMSKLLHDIKAKAKTENEEACIDAIITIFNNVEEIDFLNKSAVLLYMRELSGLTPKQLTATMQSIKKHYKKLKK
jgi:hypothetical protein